MSIGDESITNTLDIIQVMKIVDLIKLYLKDI